VFRDSTANSIGASATTCPGIGYWNVTTLTCEVPANSTSSTTFKLSAGSANGLYTLNINGPTTGSRALGGVCMTSLIVEEIKV